MKTLLFKVEGQRITRIDNIIPVAKCRNLYKAHFDFLTPEWEGTKTAIFSQRNYSKAQILDEKNECMIPWEFFDTEINIRGSVTVFCGDLVTANSTYVDIEKAGYQNSDATVPPTPDVYQQMIDILNAAKKIAQDVRDDADAGKFHGENGESAYQIAIRLGFRGTEQEWIESLKYDHSEEFTKLAAEVRNTASGIVADRQQIGQNKADVTQLKEALNTLNQGGLVMKDTVISKNVQDWLDAHPEATTTVQDGSLTEAKIQPDFLKKIKKDYITPQMFGAKGDGVHDDTLPMQKSLEFCENNKKLLYIPCGVYSITNSLTINKSVSIKGATYHRDMLSSNNQYMGISVLKFSTNTGGTFITTQEKAYDVSISFLSFTCDSYSVETSGEIASKGNPKKYYKAVSKVPNVNCLNLEKSIRGSIDNCTFNGFSEIGVITGQHRHITDCTFTNCNIAINTSGFDNLIHHCWFRLCSICIYTLKNNTLFLSDSWFDQIEQIAIKNLGGGFMMISNCEFDLIEYCAIYTKFLWNSYIQARQSRCGLYYAGSEPNEIPDSEEYKACCIYSESVSKYNNLQINIQRREIKPGYGVAPSFFFQGKGLNNSSVTVDIDLEHIAKKWLFENTDFSILGKKYKTRYSLKYNEIGCVTRDDENPNNKYYSIDVGDVYISTNGKIYMSVKGNSNLDWVLIGEKRN